MGRSPKNKAEVLRYLGYNNQKLDKATDNLIEESMEEIKNLIEERYVYKFFNIIRKKENLLLDNCTLSLEGKHIKQHLNRSQSCILLAVTLGNDVDSKIRYYEKVSMTKALILDACATTAIEEICDKICEELENIANIENKTLTTRYSPGYGDLPIDIQKDFLSVLGAEKAIGLTASASSILIPRKSVTAIIGVINKEDKVEKPSCLYCNKYSTCMFKRKDGRCGY